MQIKTYHKSEKATKFLKKILQMGQVFLYQSFRVNSELIHVASNSELHENQWNDLLFFEIDHSRKASTLKSARIGIPHIGSRNFFSFFKARQKFCKAFGKIGLPKVPLPSLAP